MPAFIEAKSFEPVRLFTRKAVRREKPLPKRHVEGAAIALNFGRIGFVDDGQIDVERSTCELRGAHRLIAWSEARVGGDADRTVDDERFLIGEIGEALPPAGEPI